MSKDFISTYLKQCWGVASSVPGRLSYSTWVGVVVTGINSKGKMVNCRGCSGESPGRGDNMGTPQGLYQ